MKSFLMSRLLAAILLLVAVPALAAKDAPDRHVVVITVDGLPSYYLDDPHASLPVIRGLRDTGASAKNGMRVSNPSVTWPNHTTLMTGVHPETHGVLCNGVPERMGTGKPVRVVPEKTQQELVRKVPLLFDVLKKSGLSSAAINWPCTAGSSSIDDNFPDVPNELRYTTPRLKDELKEAGVLQRFDDGAVARDEVWTEATCQVIRRRKPSFLALHLLILDSTHHRYGPKSMPGYTAAALADANIGRVLEALDDAGIRDQTTIFIVADHGFAQVKKSLRPNVLLKREGLLKTKGNTITSARVQVVAEGGIGLVYLTNPETADQDRDTVLRLFHDAEGVSAVIKPADFPKYHLPSPADYDRMADLVLAARDGYSFSGSVAGDSFVVPNDNPTGTHGYLSTEPKMNAIFVASGSGIRPGARLDTIDNVDIAPTVAKLLGVPLDQASGRVLKEILGESD
jgi:predicted AlkP superfamily pyrophosphatase or phosphodiesterase